MEELQSTEILEREILEDARKKALRVLKAADETIQAKNIEWKEKTDLLTKDLAEKYGEEKKLLTEKLMARLPIDKLRAKIERIERLLQDAVGQWYNGLSRERALGLLKDELAQRLAYNDDFASCVDKTAYYHGLSLNEAQALLRVTNEKFTLTQAAGEGGYPSIVLETENARITASIQNIIDYYLLEKREELIEAMLGLKFMEDA